MRVSKTQPDKLLLSLEGHLQTSLHPVSPDPQFINLLKKRLVTTNPIILEKETSAISMLLIAFGLLTGVTVLLLGWRAVILLLAGIGVLVNRQKKGNKSSG